MVVDDPLWPRADRWLARRHPHPDVIVTGVPTASASLTPSRADLTPEALRRTLARFSTFHGEWQVDLDPIGMMDTGDWPLAELDMWAMPVEVERLAADLPETPLRLFLGGDNAITRPLVRSLGRGGLTRVGVLTFDAHHDVRSLDGGPTNGTPIRGLVEQDGLPGANVAQVGIHSFANALPYRRYCDEVGIAVYPMETVDAWGIEEVVATALDTLDRSCEAIHVDVDLDVLDRASAPACPGARPGGMGVRLLTAGVRLCGRHPKVRSLDFVEVDAGRDVAGLTLDALATVFLAAVAGYAERRQAAPPSHAP